MRARMAIIALAAGIALTAAAPAVARKPSRRQISRAVHAAEHSRTLWATVNICDSRRHPNTLGVRGQMPALGFRATLRMRIRVDYWSTAKKAFVPIHSRDAVANRSLGRVSSSRLLQDGAEFRFAPHAGLFNATITFTWRRDGRLLGKVRRTTTAGHHRADYGSPPHYSAARCRIR